MSKLDEIMKFYINNYQYETLKYNQSTKKKYVNRLK